MKSFLFFLFLGMQFGAIAQPVYQVIETPKVLGENWQNSYTVALSGIDEAAALAVWDAKMKNAGGMTVANTGSDAVAYNNVVLPMISAQPLQVFVQPYEDTEAETTHFTVWFKLGDHFISSRSMPASFQPISRYLIQFSFQIEDVIQKTTGQELIQKATGEYPKVKN